MLCLNPFTTYHNHLILEKVIGELRYIPKYILILIAFVVRFALHYKAKYENYTFIDIRSTFTIFWTNLL